MIFRKSTAWLAMTALAAPALAGSNLPLVTQSGQTRQLPAGTTLAVQPSTTGAASLNIPQGTAPASPVNGDIWTRTDGAFAYINGSNWALATQANVLAYGADLTGVADSATAFTAAVAAAGVGGTVYVPKGIYRLDTNPASGFPAVSFKVAPGTTYTGNGAGASGLGSYGSPPFGHTYTNPFNTTTGSMTYCSALPYPAAPNGNITQCYAEELLAPSSGLTRQVLGYYGADSNENTTNGTWQEIFNLVHNVRKADLIGTDSSYVPLEIDLNVDVSTNGASIPSDVGLTGLLITGGGAGSSFQPGLNGTAFSAQRSTGAWHQGYRVWNARDGVSTNAYRHGILVASVYRGNASDPVCPSGTFPSGCAIQNGFYMDNAPYFAGTSFAAGQIANGNDAIALGRATDSSPTGNFLRFMNHANSVELFKVSTAGDLTSAGFGSFTGTMQLNGAAGTFRYIHFDTAGSSRWEIGENATAEGGSNAGSDFYISRRTDAGAANGTPLSITRSNGIVKTESALMLASYTVATLPTCNATYKGVLVHATDVTTVTYNAAPTGGGSNDVPVFCNGSGWTIH